MDVKRENAMKDSISRVQLNNTKKFLIIKPKYGLCNQLLSISKGIILGLITKRDIIFNSFQLDYRNINNVCEFHKIIDIDDLQEKLNIININIKVYSSIDINGIKMQTFTNDDISYIKDLIPMFSYECNMQEKHLDVDNPISATLPSEYDELYKYINLNIKFTDKYINIANNIKTSLKLSNYTCIHLRLEDDSINFMKEQNKKIDLTVINDIYKNKYLTELDYIKNLNIDNHIIYICTSLGIDHNLNNDFYNEIKKKYNLVDKNDFIDFSNTDNDESCRELYGIIDYIIAKGSIYFIGSDWSSYSIYLYTNHKHDNKATKLIDIWETVINL